MAAHKYITNWLMPLRGFTDAQCTAMFHHEQMVKTKGIAFVALATLLAGFVASCTSAEVPSIEDIQSLEPAAAVELDDEPPALSSPSRSAGLGA